ncbi:MAG: tyrosine--tRNA ligase, partial [archaeon]|nr:tyrosine--tRNA ligase [archaeon]
MDVEDKINLIKTFAEEIVTEDELRELLRTKKKIIAYDGFEPSGQIHIAQGLMRAITVNKITSCGIKFKFWVADWFAMLNNKYDGDLEKIRVVGEYFIEVWKACGLDMKNVEFVWASDFIRTHPEYWETVLKLSRSATCQRVLRCGQIMGREDSVHNPSAQILYPLMQAADIYHLDVDIAQLGFDQRKVNMLARDIFPKISLKPPIAIHHHMLLGLQFKESNLKGIDRKIALKMSKSKPETAIFMTDSRDEIYGKFNKAYCPEGE